MEPSEEVARKLKIQREDAQFLARMLNASYQRGWSDRDYQYKSQHPNKETLSDDETWILGFKAGVEWQKRLGTYGGDLNTDPSLPLSTGLHSRPEQRGGDIENSS